MLIIPLVRVVLILETHTILSNHKTSEGWNFNGVVLNAWIHAH